MILPLSENPTAPAQGALAIECRSEDIDTHKILKKLHHPITEACVSRERQILKDWGGGCHQILGATAILHPELSQLLFIKGIEPKEHRAVEVLDWTMPPQTAHPISIRPWNGADSPEKRTSQSTGIQVRAQANESYFLAHSRALPTDWTEPTTRRSRLWTSGVQSWFRLAEKGFWVEGCTEGLGISLLKAFFGPEGSLFRTLHPSWTILTHEDAVQGALGSANMALNSEAFPKGVQAQTVATYGFSTENSEVSNPTFFNESGFKNASHYFWMSFSQFQAGIDHCSKEAVHACGAGKTAALIRAFRTEIDPKVFPSVQEWETWVTLQTEGVGA